MKISRMGAALLSTLALLSMSRPLPVVASKQATLLPQQQTTPIDEALQKQAEQAKTEALKLAQAGQLPAALLKFKEARELYGRAHDLKGEARQAYNVGLVYSNLGDYQNALASFNEALSLLRAVGDLESEANTLVNIGLVYKELHDTERQLQSYLAALAPLHAGGDRTKEAQILLGVASLYDARDEPGQALDYLNRAVPLWQALGDRQNEAITTDYLALIHFRMDDYPQAILLFERSLGLWRALGDRPKQAAVLRSLARLNNSMGQLREALDFFNQALALYSANDDRAERAATLEELGMFYERLSDRSKSDEYYRQAIQLRLELHDAAGAANTLLNLGDNAYREGFYQQALDYYDAGRKYWREAKDRTGEARTLNKMGAVFEARGEKNDATIIFKEAQALWHGLGEVYDEAYTLRKLALVSLREDDGSIEPESKRQALDYLRQSVALSGEVKSLALKAYLLAYIGEAFAAMAEYQKAIEVHRQAHELHLRLKDRTGEALALSSLGFDYEGLGEDAKALDYYRQSINIYEQLREAASLEEIKTGLATESANVYQRMTLLLFRLGRAAEAFDYTERGRARSLLDQLGNSRLNLRSSISAELSQQEQTLARELRVLDERWRALLAKADFREDDPGVAALGQQLYVKQKEYEALLTRIKLANPEYASLKTVNPLSLAEVQKLLDDRTTLLSYYVTPDKTLAFIIARDSFQAVELPVRERLLRGYVEAFRRFDNMNRPPDSSQPNPLKQLYTMLVAPLRPQLKTPVVGLVPNGILHYLPFAALLNGTRYFGDEFALFHLPSASTLPFILQKRKAEDQTALVMAQSRAENLPPLLNADREAQSIARLYNTQPLTGPAATETCFRAQSGRYNVLHLAAHGQLNSGNPLFSRILLGADKEADGSLEVREIYELNLARADLVVLSACVTQLGAQSPGDDIVGLNRAFIYAGAPSVVASLWSVDDEATAYLMSAFYSSLRQGMAKAAALQVAQRRTRQRFPHPYYWSAFVLTGDPGATVKPDTLRQPPTALPASSNRSTRRRASQP